MREWLLIHNERPFTTNTERKWHHLHRAQVVKSWREAFYWLAKEANIPPLKAIEIEVTPVLSGRGRTQDVAGAAPSAKAALDGLVDAGILPDDGPLFVRRISFNAPEKGPAALRLIVRELE